MSIYATSVQCHYCSNPGLTVDHIVPRKLKGPDLPWNKVPACSDCNHKKGAEFPTCKCDKCTNAVYRWRKLNCLSPVMVALLIRRETDELAKRNQLVQLASGSCPACGRSRLNCWQEPCEVYAFDF